MPARAALCTLTAVSMLRRLLQNNVDWSIGVIASDPTFFERLQQQQAPVYEQAMHVCGTTVVQSAWERRQKLAVHGLIYGLHNGRLLELGGSVERPEEVAVAYDAAVHGITSVPTYRS